MSLYKHVVVLQKDIPAPDAATELRQFVANVSWVHLPKASAAAANIGREYPSRW